MNINIGKSKLHGKGLIASRDIKKGETIFTIKGNKINFLIDSKEQAKKAGFNWIGISKNTWIDPVNYALYINHSCNPNSIIKGKVTVKAFRKIKLGEEITFDYSLSESDIFWNIKCDCGSSDCRKTIKSIQFLPHKTFKKFKPYLSSYFISVYRNFSLSNFNNDNELKISWIDFLKKDFKV